MNMTHQSVRRRARPASPILAALLLSVFFGGTVTATSPSRTEPNGFRLAKPGYVYEFPRDHGSHDEFRTEWWYYTGHVTSMKCRRFGFQMTFFRRVVAADQLHTLPSRFAVSDLDGKQFRYAEKISREGLGKAGADAGRLHVWTDRWLAEAAKDEPPAQHLIAEQDGVAIDFTLRQLKPPVVHGEAGVSRKGAQIGQASHYYSLTRLGTEGRLTIDGETFHVTGSSWMDHEFGSADLGEDLVGWDWFSLQLQDGHDVMIYQLRRADGSLDPASSGTLVYPDGRPGALSRDDAAVTVISHWTSPVSGARYPAQWRVTVPSLQLDVLVIPLMANQELATRRSTQVTYWEGAVRISGTAQGRAVTGQGYVELTGYAERFTERL